MVQATGDTIVTTATSRHREPQLERQEQAHELHQKGLAAQCPVWMPDSLLSENCTFKSTIRLTFEFRLMVIREKYI